MSAYAILQNPGHNRVYFNQSHILSVNELTLAARRFSTPTSNIREQVWGGVRYIYFETERPLSEADLIQLSRLSFPYALYAVNENGPSPALTPLMKDPSYYFSDDIGTMLKYTGKTNELFTRLMLNLALTCVSYNTMEGLNLLDPLCGKGTTLFEALPLGYNAYGVELEEQLACESFLFLRKYLETARYKHATHMEKVGGQGKDGKKFSAQRYQIELAKNKSDQQSGRTLQWEVVAGDTRYVNTYFKKNTFHIIAGDLPYGVQHASDKKNSFTRNPWGLLTEALPEWVKVLKTGGAIVLAWNVFLVPRTDMEELFISHGLSLPEDPVYKQFSHRVDQAIDRDVIVGIKG